MEKRTLALALVLVVFGCLLFQSVGAQNQPTYAIGATSMTYPNYQVYTFPLSDIDTFVATYNHLGGLPSLGVGEGVAADCTLNAVWSGDSLESCICPFVASTGQIVQVGVVNSPYCLGSISTASIQPVTFQPYSTGLAFFKSTLDPSCSQACQLNGQCINGQCVCNPGWTGTDCQDLITPKGFNSSLWTVSFTSVNSGEFFSVTFYDKPNCTMYLVTPPSSSPWGPAVAYSDLAVDTKSFQFALNSPEEIIYLRIWIQAPEVVDACFGTTSLSNPNTKGQISTAGSMPYSLNDGQFGITLPQYSYGEV